VLPHLPGVVGEAAAPADLVGGLRRLEVGGERGLGVHHHGALPGSRTTRSGRRRPSAPSTERRPAEVAVLRHPGRLHHAPQLHLAHRPRTCGARSARTRFPASARRTPWRLAEGPDLLAQLAVGAGPVALQLPRPGPRSVPGPRAPAPRAPRWPAGASSRSPRAPSWYFSSACWAEPEERVAREARSASAERALNESERRRSASASRARCSTMAAVLLPQPGLHARQGSRSRGGAAPPPSPAPRPGTPPRLAQLRHLARTLGGHRLHPGALGRGAGRRSASAEARACARAASPPHGAPEGHPGGERRGDPGHVSSGHRSTRGPRRPAGPREGRCPGNGHPLPGAQARPPPTLTRRVAIGETPRPRSPFCHRWAGRAPPPGVSQSAVEYEQVHPRGSPTPRWERWKGSRR